MRINGGHCQRCGRRPICLRDKTATNTSPVTCLNPGSRQLIFPGSTMPLSFPQCSAEEDSRKATVAGGHRPPYSSSQLRETARTVALLVLVNVVHIQDAEQEISCRYRLSVEVNVASAFELPVDTADEEVRHVVVLVLIR